jgi:hypothetical protein
VLGTQIVATLIAVYGLFMTPLGWGWAGFVWGYALLWFLLNDRVKLLAYRIFDPVKAEAKPEAKTDTRPEAKAEPKSDAKAEPQTEAKVEPQPETKPGPKHEAKAKTPSDLTPQIATRAYELYEQQGRRDGQSAQNWDKAEREIRKDQAKAEPKPEAKTETRPEVKAEPKSDAKAEPQPEAKVEPKPETKAEPKPEVKAESKLEAKPTVEPQPESKVEPQPEANAKAEPKPATKVKPSSEVSPQLVKRVHKLYEELGRQDVRAVQELEEAEQKIPGAGTKE